MFSRFSISFLMPLIQDCASSAVSATRSKLFLRPRKTNVKHRSAGNSSAMLRRTSDWWPSRIVSTSLTETSSGKINENLGVSWGFSWKIYIFFLKINRDQFILTCGVGVASLLGLVPDSHAVILQLEVALLFPGTRFDFPQYGAYLHRLDVVIPQDTSIKGKKKTFLYSERHQGETDLTSGVISGISLPPLEPTSLHSVSLTLLFWAYFDPLSIKLVI